jgi:hypothetical protein
MVQRSTIEQLPPEQRVRVDALCADKSLTLTELRDLLAQEIGEDAPSRSALGRYRKSVEQVAGLMRSSREAVKQLRADLGDLSDDDQSKLNYEMVQEQIFRLQMKVMSEGEDAHIDVKELRGLSDALYRLSAARKTDADRIVRIKQEAAKEATQKAIHEVEAVAAKTPGFSADTVAAIKERILGIKPS